MRSQLLKKIHEYYPIGIPMLREEYPGYAELRSKIEMKIQHLLDEDITPLSKLINELKANISFEIEDFSHHQFPSYYFAINLKTSNTENVSCKKSLLVFISLLTNHYTFFFEDHYDFYYKNKNLEYSKSLFTKVFYYSSFPLNENLNFLEKILHKIIPRFFEQYDFINHDLLFETKVIGGMTLVNPERYDPWKEYSCFEYLFSNIFCDLPNISILK